MPFPSTGVREAQIDFASLNSRVQAVNFADLLKSGGEK
jgi:hypothetical protein